MLERAGIVLEIVSLAELQWVHEDRDHDLFRLGRRSVDELAVATVQCPHRRHERDGVAERTGGVRPGARRAGRVDDDGHESNASGCVELPGGAGVDVDGQMSV